MHFFFRACLLYLPYISSNKPYLILR